MTTMQARETAAAEAAALAAAAARLRARLVAHLPGLDGAVDELLAAYLARGHALLEGRAGGRQDAARARAGGGARRRATGACSSRPT